MSDNWVIRKRVLPLVLLALAAILAWWPELGETPVCEPDRLCVAFLDVGQGDAIFIQTPSNTQLLIDSGRDASVLRELSEVMEFSDRTLDYILITHPDADHITGFKEVLDRYEVESVIRSENESDTPIWKAVESAIEKEGSAVYFARRGQRYDLGGRVRLEILFPDTDPADMEANTASIVARLTYGNTAFMLTGDAPKSIEEYLVLVEGEHLKSDVLKAGHHGSRTSTSELFLAEVDPDYAVISAGAGNSYGHPHVEVTDLLFNYGVETLTTFEAGRVVFHSDGSVVEKK